ncbi:MAG TPA: holo-ACP synthase [Woeseiaceae bacterium]|nr:holo-ACP synthase [Woeseiaceae bacterium]
MIFGIGTDIVQVARIEETFKRFGERFVERLLMPEERVLYERTQQPVRFLAMRFAAKEAAVKAMGTGFRHGMWIRDVGVLNNDWGRPYLIFSERGESTCRRLGVGEGHVSLTDDGGFVVAFAVLMQASATAPAGS